MSKVLDNVYDWNLYTYIYNKYLTKDELVFKKKITTWKVAVDKSCKTQYIII